MFHMTDLIAKKRDGGVLSKEEINGFIKGYVKGEIPDYQASAFLMAVYFRGMSDEEIFDLTEAMKNSGEIISLNEIDGVKVDKHSSGGVGDKISLTACPTAAAAGVKIAKMSGRGLGFTGGTIDKLESIKGFKTDISMDAFKNNVKKCGMSIISQSEEIAKADKLLYALRDVTATVDSKALIASSIMSKKLAMGSDAVLLDVKYGNGALMKSRKEAEQLALIMMGIGKKSGKKTIAAISDMDQPLGTCIGNSIEVIEAIEVLKGNGASDIYKQTVEMAGKMIFLGNLSDDEQSGIKMAENLIRNGKALETFKEFIGLQGGDIKVIDDYSLFPKAKFELIVYGKDIGVKENAKIKRIKAMTVGEASQVSGAGRSCKGESIDCSAGIRLLKKSDDEIKREDEIAVIYASNEKKAAEALEILKKAYEI